MSPLLVGVSVTSVVIAVITAIPEMRLLLNFVFKTNLTSANTCIDAVVTLCGCSFCAIQIFALS